MTQKIRIWIAGLFVASFSWALFLHTYVYPEDVKRVRPLLEDVIIFALSFFIISGIVAGISFAFMKFRKEKAVKALWIWTIYFIISALVMLNG